MYSARRGYFKPSLTWEIRKMKKLFLFSCMFLFMIMLIGTAYADWFTASALPAPAFPEHAALIGLGAVMIALGAYGRRAVSTRNSQS
jgi:CHASE2 domain-containing sensor protein